MTKNRCIGIGHGPNDALGLRREVHFETSVHARNDEVERFQQLVRVIERAIRKNVGLYSLEDAKTVTVFSVEPVGLRQLFGDFCLA